MKYGNKYHLEDHHPLAIIIKAWEGRCTRMPMCLKKWILGHADVLQPFSQKYFFCKIVSNFCTAFVE